MPTYVYACKACGHGFEKQQSFTDAALTTCPECGGSLRKVFNSVGVTFKGSGFYRTDSRGPSSSSSSSASTSASSKAPGSASPATGSSGGSSSS